MKWVAIAVATAAAIWTFGGQRGPADVNEEMRVNGDPISVLRSSEDPWELNDAAKALAKSDDPAHHAALAEALSDGRVLGRLDTEEDYEGDSRHLRLAAVLKALADNASPSARQALLRISESQAFTDHPARVDLMIDALTFLRPAPPPAIRFWDTYGQPEDGFVERTVRRLAENGSEPAILLLERKLTDERFDAEVRAWWIRRHVLVLRDDPVMLAACERMLAGTLEPELRPGLIEVLFDYQPKAWYRPHDVPPLPDRAAASREALESLLRIGTRARREQTLDALLDARVAAAIEDIGRWIRDQG